MRTSRAINGEKTLSVLVVVLLHVTIIAAIAIDVVVNTEQMSERLIRTGTNDDEERKKDWSKQDMKYRENISLDGHHFIIIIIITRRQCHKFMK